MNAAQALARDDAPRNIVRELNDNLRRNLFAPSLHGEVLFTAGVSALRDDNRLALPDEVRCFEDFTPDNDQYGEHDFGAVQFCDNKYFFKIDYYDNDLTAHSPDKSNPALTRRVLTIMQTDEY